MNIYNIIALCCIIYAVKMRHKTIIENSPEYDFWITFQYLTRTGFAFIAPLIIIIYCYMSIYMFLRKRRKAQDGLIIQTQST